MTATEYILNNTPLKEFCELKNGKKINFKNMLEQAETQTNEGSVIMMTHETWLKCKKDFQFKVKIVKDLAMNMLILQLHHETFF